MPQTADPTLKALIFSVLFPLLAAEIVISLAFWLLFAPTTSQFITRSLHGQRFQKVAHCNKANCSLFCPWWAAAGSVDTDLSFQGLIELYRTHITQR